MSFKAKHTEFTPDYHVHPGQFLEEELEINGLKQSDLAKRTGLTSKTINTIIKGNAPISPDTAVLLESVLGKPALYWLNLDAIYQLNKANNAQYKSLEKDINLLDQIDIAGITNNGWIKKHNNKIQQLKALLSFFGVSTVKQLASVWTKLEVNFRTSQAYSKNHLNIMTWLRRGEILAQKIDCAPYDANSFRKSLEKCRTLTTHSFPEIEIEIQHICSKSGVAVVFVPVLKNVSTSGAAHWISKDKALIQLSLWGKKDDKFWFNFYHEAGHILLHGRKEQFIDSTGSSQDQYRDEDTFFTHELKLVEAEADDFAANSLIPKKYFSEFVLKNKFTSKNVIDFAKQQGIAPGIVVGQLQKNEHIGWGKLNNLKKTYDFSK